MLGQDTQRTDLARHGRKADVRQRLHHLLVRDRGTLTARRLGDGNRLLDVNIFQQAVAEGIRRFRALPGVQGGLGRVQIDQVFLDKPGVFLSEWHGSLTSVSALRVWATLPRRYMGFQALLAVNVR
jgi:hypothetical protein